MAVRDDLILKVGILTVSDRCHERAQEDLSGKNLTALVKEKITGHGDLKILYGIVPDVIERIKEKLLSWCDEDECAIVFTTGGTGFAPRDVTPEATREVIEKEAPGLSTKMLLDSLKVTHMAVLSRPVCGIRGKTIIINLPGSRKGSQECFQSVLPVLNHALDLVRDKKSNIIGTHRGMEEELPSFLDISGKRAKEDHVCTHIHSSEEQGPGRSALQKLERVAERDRESPYPMLSVKEATQIILANSPVLEKEDLGDIQDGLDRILVTDIYSKEPHPPFPASIKDGYAVISSDGAGQRRVLEPIVAGDVPTQALTTGFVSRIATGAPLPPGADAVVQVEDTEVVETKNKGKEEAKINILTTPQAGQDIRPIGFDIANGERVLCTGDRLGPAELGLLAAVGITKVSVVKRPVVGILSTGNEIVNPGEVRKKGTIYDCNRTSLKALVRQFGFEVVDLGIASDRPTDLIEKLKKGFTKCDVVVTSGGVSMGEKDIVKPILEDIFNAKVHFGRVHMKPGKPTTFGTVTFSSKNKLVFALPGNPVSAVVTFHLFVLPALQKMSGCRQVGLQKLKVKLGFAANLDPRPEFQRAHLIFSDNMLPDAVTTGNQCSSRLISMRSADCLLVLPRRTEECTFLEIGSVVDALILRK